MSASLAEVLLRIAAAVAADGGARVRRALEDALQEAVPFDVGEVAFARTQGDSWRQPLGAAAGPLLGLDLLDHVLAHGSPYRIDDWRDAEPFAETLGLLRARGLRSLLTVPFRFDAPGVPPLLGALAVGRSQGWAFVGASLPFLGPLASMAGLALDRTLVLTTLRERAHALEAVSPRSARAYPEVHGHHAEDHRPDPPTPAATAAAGQVRIRELQERISELEGTIRALESETARLEAERIRLEEELKQARAELQVALDQVGAFSPPASARDSGRSRGGRPGRRDRPR